MRNVGPDYLARERAAWAQIRAESDTKGCHYGAVVGTVCNKCGRLHIPPKDEPQTVGNRRHKDNP